MARWDAADVLPEPAAQKFRRLSGLAQDRQAATRRAFELVEDAREAVAKARLALHHGERSPLPTADAINRLQADIDAHESDLRQLIEERDHRGAKSRAITGLVGNIERYVGNLPSSLKVSSFRGPLLSRKSAEPPEKVIMSCRGEIQKIRDRIAEVEIAPRPADEVVAAALAEIDALAARGEPAFEALSDGSGGVTWPMQALDLIARSSDGAPLAANASDVDTLGLIAWLMKPALVKAVSAAVYEQDAGSPTAIASSQRPKLLTQLRNSLLEIERAEELAIEELETATNTDLERRAEADPRAVLGLSSDLPIPRH